MRLFFCLSVFIWKHNSLAILLWIWKANHKMYFYLSDWVSSQENLLGRRLDCLFWMWNINNIITHLLFCYFYLLHLSMSFSSSSSSSSTFTFAWHAFTCSIHPLLLCNQECCSSLAYVNILWHSTYSIIWCMSQMWSRKPNGRSLCIEYYICSIYWPKWWEKCQMNLMKIPYLYLNRTKQMDGRMDGKWWLSAKIWKTVFADRKQNNCIRRQNACKSIYNSNNNNNMMLSILKSIRFS